MSTDEIAVLFSGGTDSTLTAALMQEKFSRVHLLTYDRYGFHSTENTSVNAQMLKEKYGESKFIHKLMNVDQLFQHLSYEGYFANALRHGFFLLSTCGLCKLAMHVKTVQYCVQNKVPNVCDGANQGMSLSEPAQMKTVIDELSTMYAHFGVVYSNPVYFMTPPAEKPYITEANLQLVPSLQPKEQQERGETPGQRLFKMGLAPEPNVKGSPYDRKRQPRCFQLTLFNVFARLYYNAPEKKQSYSEKTLEIMRQKIQVATRLIEENLDSGKHSKLFA